MSGTEEFPVAAPEPEGEPPPSLVTTEEVMFFDTDAGGIVHNLAYLRFIETGWTDELAHRLLLKRHALHASRLRIDEGRDWSSPLPKDLRDWLL